MPDQADTMREAGDSTKRASYIARYGNRYYPVDPGYDKRVYENTGANWAIIVVALFAFWGFNALHWYGILCFGIVASPILTIYSLSIFGFTILFGVVILISGAKANFKKRKHEFLKEKIAELEADELDRREREKQDKEYKAKLAAQEAQKAQILGTAGAIGAQDVQVSINADTSTTPVINPKAAMQ